MNISEKIKMYRKMKLLSQRELGEKAGLSEFSIRKYEAGSRKPKIEQIIKIAEALDINQNLLTPTQSSDEMSTIGDLMSVLINLIDNDVLELNYKTDDKKSVIDSSITLKFKNSDVNDALNALILNKLAYEQDLLLYNDCTKEEYEWEENMAKSLLEQQKQQLQDIKTKLF